MGGCTVNSHLSGCSSGFRNTPLACVRNSARCSSMLIIALDAYGATCSLYLAHLRISAFFVRVYLRCGHLRCLENLSCNSLWTVLHELCDAFEAPHPLSLRTLCRARWRCSRDVAQRCSQTALRFRPGHNSMQRHRTTF